VRIEDQKKARELRAEGWTLPEIAAEVKAGKGLVSLWVRDVDIGKAGLERIAERKLVISASGRIRNPANAAKGRDMWSKQRRAAREVFREEGRVAAKLGNVNHALACALYWAEGTKNKNVIQIVNGDVNVLKVFLSFCRSFFHVKNEEIKYSISGYTNVNSAEVMKNYWVSHLDLTGAVAKKHTFDDFRYATRGVSGKRVGKLPYGMCTIKVCCSTRIIQHIYGALEVYGGTVIDPLR
jgi:hypothetical protein